MQEYIKLTEEDINLISKFAKSREVIIQSITDAAELNSEILILKSLGFEQIETEKLRIEKLNKYFKSNILATDNKVEPYFTPSGIPILKMTLTLPKSYTVLCNNESVYVFNNKSILVNEDIVRICSLNNIKLKNIQ